MRDHDLLSRPVPTLARPAHPGIHFNGFKSSKGGSDTMGDFIRPLWMWPGMLTTAPQWIH